VEHNCAFGVLAKCRGQKENLRVQVVIQIYTFTEEDEKIDHLLKFFDKQQRINKLIKIK
jgi:hypothetical protein